MVKVILRLILSMSMTAQAAGIDCAKPVQVIKLGDIATCDGFLFSDEAEKQASNAVDDMKTYKLLNEKLQLKSDLLVKENDIMSRRLDLYIKQSEELSKRLTTNENYESVYRIVYFALGAVITGFIAANVQK